MPCLDDAPLKAGVVPTLRRALDRVDTAERPPLMTGRVTGPPRRRSQQVDYLLRLPRNRGSSVAFQTGMREEICAGADIIFP